MRGVVFTGHRKLEIMSFDDPVPADDGVVLEMKASGFCGSDLHHYRGERGASFRSRSPAFLAEHGLTPDTPIVAGPRAVWRDRRGRQGAWTQRSFRKGDRVMVYHYDGCGYCDQCRTGWMQMWLDRGATVYSGTPRTAVTPTT